MVTCSLAGTVGAVFGALGSGFASWSISIALGILPTRVFGSEF